MNPFLRFGDDLEYTWRGISIAWFSSQEKVEVGTVRYILGRLFYARSVYSISSFFSSKSVTNWVSCLECHDPEVIRAFGRKVFDL